MGKLARCQLRAGMKSVCMHIRRSGAGKYNNIELWPVELPCRGSMVLLALCGRRQQE